MWSLQVVGARASSDSLTCSVEWAHKDASNMKNLRPHRRELDSEGGISRPLKSLSPGLKQISVHHLGNKHKHSWPDLAQFLIGDSFLAAF